MELYEDQSKTPAERAKDLLTKMNGEEKINQLSCCLLTDPYGNEPETEIGSIAIMNAGNNPHDISQNMGRIQRRVIQKSRFGIPALFHAEALTGPIQPGCAVFPLPIGNAASFNENNVKKMAQITKEQLKAMGIRHALSPVLDIARDFRYGRVGETFGSDPTLVSEMGCAFVQGMQGEDIKTGIAATAKHFLGCAQPEAGVNQTRTVVDERELKEVIARPFEAAIRNSDLKAVMNSYGEINGEPFCGSKYYLDDFLRGQLGFEGITVSDYHSIERLIQPFRLVQSQEDAAALAINSGMDMEFPSKMLYSQLTKAQEHGKVAQSTIDRAVFRVLKLKFELGLFETPYPVFNEKVFDDTQYEKFLTEATSQTITLVKNSGILPVTDTSLKIGIVGQPADSLRHMFGAYTAPATTEMLMELSTDKNAVGMAGVRLKSAEDSTEKVTLKKINDIIREQYPMAKTIRKAMEEHFPHVEYAEGFTVGQSEETGTADLREAVEIAKTSDILIVCVGGKNGVGRKCTSGEGIDTTQIGLPDGQEEIVKELYTFNPNMIVVHTDARPLVSRFIYDNVPGIVEAWLPCCYGGAAIADIIAGRFNPCGHLPVDVPKSTGQTPYYYSQRNGSSIQSIRECTGDFIVNKDGYIDEKRDAERPFGYGLSYTEFEYTHMMLEVNENGEYRIEADIQNTGDKDGGEVVQLYGIDEYAAVVRPTKELLGFSHIFLNAGEKVRIFFTGNLSQFAFAGHDENFRVEAGVFRFEISTDSATPVLSETYDLQKDISIERCERVYYANAGSL